MTLTRLEAVAVGRPLLSAPARKGCSPGPLQPAEPGARKTLVLLVLLLAAAGAGLFFTRERAPREEKLGAAPTAAGQAGATPQQVAAPSAGQGGASRSGPGAPPRRRALADPDRRDRAFRSVFSASRERPSASGRIGPRKPPQPAPYARHPVLRARLNAGPERPRDSRSSPSPSILASAGRVPRGAGRR
jgi:hypothetical protein